MKKILVLLLMATQIFAQQPNKSEIVGSGNYFYGKGVSFEVNEAHDRDLFYTAYCYPVNKKNLSCPQNLKVLEIAV